MPVLSATKAISVATIAIIGGITLSLSNNDAPFVSPLHAATIDVELGSGPANCNFFCRVCGDNRHDIVEATTKNAHSSHLETCNTGSCSLHACTDPAMASMVQQVWNELAQASADDIGNILLSHNELLTYNYHRSSIQFTCDEGRIIASLPLGKEVAARVMAQLSSHNSRDHAE